MILFGRIVANTKPVEWSWDKERDAGLGLIAGAYGFTVRGDLDAVAEKMTRRQKADFFVGPSMHDLSFKARILWLNGHDQHREWLHEAAHLVCSPPWEKNPTESEEYGGIFAWERLMAKELLRRKLFTRLDYKNVLDTQDTYGVMGSLGLPPSWYRDGFPQEWGSIGRRRQRVLFTYMTKTIRLAGLIDEDDRPTFKPGVWTNEVKKRWKLTKEFVNLWPVALEEYAHA